VRLFLNGAITIVHIAPWPHYTNKNVFSDQYHHNLLYGAMEVCSIVWVQQLQMLCRRRCCKSASQHMFGWWQQFLLVASVCLCSRVYKLINLFQSQSADDATDSETTLKIAAKQLCVLLCPSHIPLLRVFSAKPKPTRHFRVQSGNGVVNYATNPCMWTKDSCS